MKIKKMTALRMSKENISRGLTLVELLVGIVVGLVVLSAAGGAMMSYMSSYKQSSELVNLNQNMRAAMDMMAKDIRRAGYFGVDLFDVNDANIKNRINQLKNNPFKNISVHGTEYSCIEFLYNKNNDANSIDEDGRFFVANSNKFGFKLDDRGVVLARNSGGDNGPCNWNSAQPITDEYNVDGDIKITALRFGLECWNIATGAKEENCMDSNENSLIRSVIIEMTGKIVDGKSSPEISQTLKHTVKIRNDYFEEN